MVSYSGTWSAEGVEAFLDETAVPVRLACHTPAGRLWMLSLWFRYDDEQLVCATGRDADIVQNLERDPSVAFEVSTNDPPYRGVRGNGTAAIEPDEDKAVLTDLLERYLGGTDSTLAESLLADDREEVAIRIQPDRVYSWDFAARMRDAVEGD